MISVMGGFTRSYLKRYFSKHKALNPKCVAGERACPPEDCGSVDGYYRVVNILQNSNHDEYEEYVEWLKGHAKNYYPYDPDEFISDKIRFDNPKQRWKYAFSQD